MICKQLVNRGVRAIVRFNQYFEVGYPCIDYPGNPTFLSYYIPALFSTFCKGEVKISFKMNDNI